MTRGDPASIPAPWNLRVPWKLISASCQAPQDMSQDDQDGILRKLPPECINPRHKGESDKSPYSAKCSASGMCSRLDKAEPKHVISAHHLKGPRKGGTLKR